MTDIRTIFFDLGGVLFELQVEQTINYLAEKAGLDPQTVEQAFPLQDYYRFERGEMDEIAFFNCWRAALDSTALTGADFDHSWGILVGEPTATMALVEKLLPHYRIWLLSNTNDFHISRLQAHYPLLERVHGRIYSYREGCRKPEPEIFQVALQKAGARADQSLFIDDMIVNVRAARQLGIRGIEFTSPAELEIELKLLGLQGLD
ncbi:MAG: HAD family phosphatase [Candidatus Neomarinimicrobiota bacterium]